MVRSLKLYALIGLWAIFGLLIGLVWMGNVILNLNELMQFVGAVAAAFFGAWAAFYLQASREVRKERALNSQGIREVQFTLVRQIQRLRNLYGQVLKPYEGDKNRWYKIPAILPVEYVDLKVDYSSLMFLLKVNPNLLMRVQVAEESFSNAVQAMNTRSEMHRHQLQPAVEAITTGIANVPKSVEEMDFLLGSMLVQSIQLATDECYACMAHATKKCEEVLGELVSEAESLFPKEKFLELRDNG